MNDKELDIIDELYFVTPFQNIARALHLSDDDLQQNLVNLYKQGYVKTFYPDPDSEIELTEEHFLLNFKKYFFLVTKAGLISHNTR